MTIDSNIEPSLKEKYHRNSENGKNQKKGASICVVEYIIVKYIIDNESFICVLSIIIIHCIIQIVNPYILMFRS